MKVLGFRFQVLAEKVSGFRFQVLAVKVEEWKSGTVEKFSIPEILSIL